MSLLTLLRDLRRRKARERHTRCVVEGVRAVEELLASGVPLVGALLGPDLTRTARGLALRDALVARGLRMEEVDDRAFASAADTDAPQGIVVAAEIPGWTLEAIPPGGPVVVLDAVQDPGNVGTILRTAAALGAAGTIALPGTVDLWNAKVIRSAVGAHFRHPAVAASWEELAALLAQRDMPLWAASMDGAPLHTITPPPTVALAVGNEGAGLSHALREAASLQVSIPITRGAESLNVAVATGILLHHLRAV